MSKRSCAMYAPNSRGSPAANGCCCRRSGSYSYILCLIVATLLLLSHTLAPAQAEPQRRRQVLSGGSATASATEAVESTADETAAIVPDQLAQASHQYRRGGGGQYAAGNDVGDYTYSNLELNLVRPDGEPTVHTRISARYTASAGGGGGAGTLEESETAEEYVAKAMQMYGARLTEPIRIPAEPEMSQQHQEQQQQLQAQQQQHSEGEGANRAAQYAAYMHQQREKQQQQQQQRDQQHQQLAEQQQQQQQQQQDQTHAQAEADANAQLGAQLQQAQFLAATEQQQQQQLQQHQQQTEPEAGTGAGKPPARSYEVYDESAGHEAGEASAAPQIERYYRTKYAYAAPHAAASSSNGGGNHQQQHYQYRSVLANNNNNNNNNYDDDEEEKLRVSASTEIPKAEIMKQIEKSVMKYMKELEAEGKIITTPQEPKTYYKVVTVPMPTEDKYPASSTTLRPKYATGSTAGYHSGYAKGSSGQASLSTSTRHHSSAKYHGTKGGQSQYQTETEGTYRAPSGSSSSSVSSNGGGGGGGGSSSGSSLSQEMSDALAPNVEFIYKIKTRAPLQTATVKTVSKPYSLALKSAGEGSRGTYDAFDHSAALKHMEDFDLSHVVTQEPEDAPAPSGHGGKSNKLYFNSDVYQDINSLPYRPEKSRLSGERDSGAGEYRKVKAASEGSQHSNGGGGDYKGYSGYFAEPLHADNEKESSLAVSGEDGYPLMNPYQYVLKKEPLPHKYDESLLASWDAASRPGHALDFDSYNPKYSNSNNNAEGYGYQQQQQHTQYKGPSHGPSGGRHHGSKRGKRGGNGGGKKGGLLVRSHKGELDAGMALRPPPKMKA